MGIRRTVKKGTHMQTMLMSIAAQSDLVEHLPPSPLVPPPSSPFLKSV